MFLENKVSVFGETFLLNRMMIQCWNHILFSILIFFLFMIELHCKSDLLPNSL